MERLHGSTNHKRGGQTHHFLGLSRLGVGTKKKKRAKPKEIFNFHFFFLWLRQLLYSLASYIALEPTRQHSVSLRRRKKTINGSTRLIFAPE